MPATAPVDGQPQSLLNPLWSVPDNDYDFEADLKGLTRKVIEAALARTDGNVSAAARLLGVPRDFIRYRQ
jgi:DNA-binding NtrC family response regulator